MLKFNEDYTYSPDGHTVVTATEGFIADDVPEHIAATLLERGTVVEATAEEIAAAQAVDEVLTPEQVVAAAEKEAAEKEAAEKEAAEKKRKAEEKKAAKAK